METLGEKQRRFTRHVGQLIAWAYANGYELTFGETYRTPEQAALNAKNGSGISNSLHTQRLAVDLNLFRNGVWLQTSDAHKPLGEYWKTLGPGCCWGGDFTTLKDGGHYSIEHGGVK